MTTIARRRALVRSQNALSLFLLIALAALFANPIDSRAQNIGNNSSTGATTINSG